jgi:hypothetical protein
MVQYSEPGQFNTYIPSHEATAYMVSGYGRNIEDFAINRYMAIRPVDKSMGFWLRWKSEQALRVQSTTLNDWAWPDGDERPRGQDNLEQFEFEEFKTTRFAPGFTIGRKTVEQADWPLQEYQTKVIGQQMMTGRTLYAANALLNATWTTNCANVDGAGGNLTNNGSTNAPILTSGQNWTNGTSTSPNIKKTFQYVLNVITKVTGGAVNVNDIVCVISPDTAIAMSQSPEVNDVMARSIYAMPNLTGELWFNEEWAIPDKLYNVRIVVDKTTYISTDKILGITPLTGYGYVIPSGAAYFLTVPRSTDKDGRPKVLVEPNNRPEANERGGERNKANYFPVIATICMFAYEEMTMEMFDMPIDRLVFGSCVSDFDIQMSSWKGGFQALRCIG